MSSTLISGVKKIRETFLKRPVFQEISKLGEKAAYNIALDLFTAHPEVHAVVWMFGVNPYAPDPKNYDVEVSHLVTDLIEDIDQFQILGVAIDKKLAEGLAIPSYDVLLESGEEKALVGYNGIVDKLPTIAYDLRNVLYNICHFKQALTAAYGTNVRISVVRHNNELKVHYTRDILKGFEKEQNE